MSVQSKASVILEGVHRCVVEAHDAHVVLDEPTVLRPCWGNSSNIEMVAFRSASNC